MLCNNIPSESKQIKCRIMEQELAVDMEDHHMEVVADMVVEVHHTAVSICHTKQF